MRKLSRDRPRLRQALEWFGLAFVILIGLMLLLGAAYAQEAKPKPPSNCEVQLNNLNLMQNDTNAKIEKWEKTRRRAREGGGRRVAVLAASEALGFYRASQILLPAICTGQQLMVLGNQLDDEIKRLRAFVDKNW